MDFKNDTIINSTYEAINELITEFRNAPYMYLYESDIQAALFTKIRRLIPVTITIPGSESPENEYQLSVVNTEYLSRIDIACLDVDRISEVAIKKHAGVDIHIYGLPVHVGIEIKYRKMGDRFGIASCIADLEKLKKLNIPKPIVLGFIQNDCDFQCFTADMPETYNLIEASEINTHLPINIISPSKIWVQSDNHV